MHNNSAQCNDISEASLAQANQLLFDKGKTFYWASLLLNKRHAQRATRFYRFCRYVDDLADEALDTNQAKKELNALILDIKADSSADPIVQDALALFNECHIEIDIVLELINGVYSDLDQVRFNSMHQLLHYCYQVAGTVGLMMCKVLDIHDAQAYPYAIDLGIAMQLTNICRDISADASLGRRYLPKDLVGDLDPAELIFPALPIQENLTIAVAHLLIIADQYYASGNAGLSFIPLRARTAILLASRLYQAIGMKLEQRNCQYWLGRAMLSNYDKTLLSLKTLAQLVGHAEFWRVMQAHQAQLHQSLAKLPYTHAQ
jgi:phytoene synthase